VSVEVEDEEKQAFKDIEKGLPTYLHFKNQHHRNFREIKACKLKCSSMMTLLTKKAVKVMKKATKVNY